MRNSILTGLRLEPRRSGKEFAQISHREKKLAANAAEIKKTSGGHGTITFLNAIEEVEILLGLSDTMRRPGPFHGVLQRLEKRPYDHGGEIWCSQWLSIRQLCR